jgi:phage terminase large subunit-like protein
MITTVIEQEAGSHTNLFFEQMRQEFPNHNIEKYKPRESKLFRSYELKRLAENHSLKFVVKDGESMNWIHTIIHELELFDGQDSTSKKHDDIVDSLSMGANYLKENNHMLFGYIDL